MFGLIREIEPIWKKRSEYGHKERQTYQNGSEVYFAWIDGTILWIVITTKCQI